MLSIRVSLLDDKELFEQKPAFNNTRREYAALRFDPKLFGENSHTSIRVKYEQGSVSSNNPRSIPPVDTINPWFLTWYQPYGNPGFNQDHPESVQPGCRSFDGIAYPGGKGGILEQRPWTW